MRIEEDIKLDFKDVLIRPKRSTLNSRRDVDLKRFYRFKHSRYEYDGIPIMAANMDGVGTIKMAEALSKHNLFTCLIKAYNRDIENFDTFRVHRDNYAVSTGTGAEDFRNLNTIVTGTGAQFICIDVANGYSEHFGDFVEGVRNRWPDKTIIAGNVVTGDMAQELILRGADIVKVGIGPGSVCTTRIQTGVGYPQLSAIIECADAAHGLGGHIIADGGCTCPGDIAKAFGAGADFVMLGGMLAGHDEGGGEVITKYYNTSEINPLTVWNDDNTHSHGMEPVLDIKQFVQFYGMSSDTAMNKHHGGIAEYRSSEGRTVDIPYRGPVDSTVLNILGGLRSACTYVGADTLKQLPKCTTFIRVNRQINDVFVK
jgi:GMP reductase